MPTKIKDLTILLVTFFGMVTSRGDLQLQHKNGHELNHMGKDTFLVFVVLFL